MADSSSMDFVACFLLEESMAQVLDLVDSQYKYTGKSVFLAITNILSVYTGD